MKKKLLKKASLQKTCVLTRLFVFDSFVSATAGLRMDKRDAGQAPNNVYEQYLDNHFPDERMNEIYANSQKVEK